MTEKFRLNNPCQLSDFYYVCIKTSKQLRYFSGKVFSSRCNVKIYSMLKTKEDVAVFIVRTEIQARRASYILGESFDGEFKPFYAKDYLSCINHANSIAVDLEKMELTRNEMKDLILRKMYTDRATANRNKLNDQNIFNTNLLNNLVNVDIFNNLSGNLGLELPTFPVLNIPSKQKSLIFLKELPFS